MDYTTIAIVVLIALWAVTKLVSLRGWFPSSWLLPTIAPANRQPAADGPREDLIRAYAGLIRAGDFATAAKVSAILNEAKQ